MTTKTKTKNDVKQMILDAILEVTELSAEGYEYENTAEELISFQLDLFAKWAIAEGEKRGIERLLTESANGVKQMYSIHFPVTVANQMHTQKHCELEAVKSEMEKLQVIIKNGEIK